VLWEASDRVCGKRLRALLPILVPAFERNGHLTLNDAIRAQILGDECRDDRPPTARDAKRRMLSAQLVGRLTGRVRTESLNFKNAVRSLRALAQIVWFDHKLKSQTMNC
jgi:hypothetical protein